MSTTKRIITRTPFEAKHLNHGALEITSTFECIDCHVLFTNNSGRGKRCKICRKKYNKEYMKRYHARTRKPSGTKEPKKCP